VLFFKAPNNNKFTVHFFLKNYLCNYNFLLHGTVHPHIVVVLFIPQHQKALDPSEKAESARTAHHNATLSAGHDGEATSTIQLVSSCQPLSVKSRIMAELVEQTLVMVFN
jgi:hypothetical protein